MFPPTRIWRILPFIALVLLPLGAFAADVRQTVLANGLTVLIKEVHAAPVVTVDVWYKAGSRNERPGRTGMSHLLEHMTYKGTTDFAKDDMRNLTKRNGAIDNGATFYDYTHYYTTIASDRAALALRIEASRMRSALILQQDLVSEMTVVRSELEGRENSPGSLLFNALMSTAYAAHPYQWPVVGWRADVQHISADQLRHYYKTYYVPNNATLVIVGDINADRTLAQVRKLFEPLKRGPAPLQWVTPEPAQRGERRVVVHRQGQVPIETIGWHIPAITHADIPALMLLDQTIGTGRLSRIYQRIVETELGVQAWSSTLILRDPGIFMVGGVAAPGKSLEPIEKALLAEVERIKTDPPSAEEMARAQRQLAALLVYARDSVSDQASQLGYYQTVAGDWQYLDRLPARLKAVTPADVARVAKTYLIEDNRTVAVFRPMAREKTSTAMTIPGAAPAGYQQPAKTATATPAPKPAAQPAKAPAPAPVVQRKRFVLPNGIVLIVQENHANATVAVRGNLKAGKAYDPAGKAGVADMVANLLDRGTVTRSSREIALELEGNAADISTGTGWETVGITGKALSVDLELLIRNMADLIRNPRFPQDEVAKMRRQMQTDLAYNRDNPAENARRGFYRAILPAGHPYRLASFGEEEAGLKAVTRDDLVAFHNARYTPQTLMMAVVGDVKVNEVHQLVEKYFGDWQKIAPPLLAFQPVPLPKPQSVVMTIPDKSEVSIYLGSAGGLRRTDPDYYASQIMNMILGGGGALNSRLGDVIRDKHGLAYSLYSTFHASTGSGPWYAVMGVNPANTEKAIALLKGEIVRMRNSGVTDLEVKDAVAYLTGAHAIALETNAALASELMDAEYFHLGLDYPERVTRLYSAVTRDQVNAAAKKHLLPDNLVTSIAGPYGKE
ncbi:MAG: M16 family metallopeptidase [Armatimonadota bacterium]